MYLPNRIIATKKKKYVAVTIPNQFLFKEKNSSWMESYLVFEILKDYQGALFDKDLSITLNLKRAWKSVAKKKRDQSIKTHQQRTFKKLKKTCRIVFMNCLY